MALSLCSGIITWHRDHDDLTLDIRRATDQHGTKSTLQKMGELPVGTSFTFEDAGVKITVENNPIV